MDPATLALIAAGLTASTKLIEAILNAVAKGNEPVTEEERLAVRERALEAQMVTEQLTQIPGTAPEIEEAKAALDGAIENAKTVISDIPDRVCLSCGQAIHTNMHPGAVAGD